MSRSKEERTSKELKMPEMGKYFLSPQDREYLITIVDTVINSMSTYGIVNLLRGKLPDPQINRIHFRDGSRNVAEAIIGTLEARGTALNPSDGHALGAFLTELLENDLVGYDTATKIVTLLFQYTLIRDRKHIAALSAQFQVSFLGQQHHADQPQFVPLAATGVQTMPVTQAGIVQIQPLPSLFTDGLCAGRPLHPDPDHYFVSHGFTPEKLIDWRQAITETLAHINHSTQPLEPYFSGDKLLSGYRLCGICERIYSTAFSLFLLPAAQDRNVYLELGIAIGLSKPFFLIQDRNAQIPSVLTSLALYTHSGSFRTMRRELAGQIEEYDFSAVQFTKETPKQQTLLQYLIVAGESFDDLDFEGSVEDALKQTYPQQHLTAFPFSQHLKQTQGFDLRQFVELIQTSRFAVYRVNEYSSPTTFLALGMSIGLSCPFIMLSQKDSEIPLNLRGLSIYQFPNYTELERDIVKWHQKILDKYMQ